MKQHIFRGCGTALVTPMKPGGRVNEKEWERLLDFQLENGADALVVCGTTGESATLSTRERGRLLELAVRRVSGRVPVIMGTGSNDTAKAVEASVRAQEAGADALLVVTPYYNKTSQQGLEAHYGAIAQAVSLPLILYNVPSRTGVNLQPETCARLAKLPNIAAVKEAGGNLAQVAKTLSLCHNELEIYSGNDGDTLPVLSLGGVGVISVASNLFPALMHRLCELYFAHCCEEAAELQIRLQPLFEALFCTVNPMPVKAAMRAVGWDVGGCRLPLTEPDAAQLALIRRAAEEAKGIALPAPQIRKP